MHTQHGHLTYCSNIHAGEQWGEHFAALRAHVAKIKKVVGPDQPFGIGLRLSNTASLELVHQKNLDAFKTWLNETGCYVFTMNGFPYGGFHHTRVKDHVHLPDWTTTDRTVYTVRLFQILSQLLPSGLDGGVSTSPLSYRHWHDENNKEEIFRISTHNVLMVAEELVKIKNTTGQVLHLDIEPEPDGLLESGPEFIKWYGQYLLPMGLAHLGKIFGYNEDQAAAAIHEHIRLCYDVCHFAVGYEDHAFMINELERLNIKTGKIQISAALKASMPNEHGRRAAVKSAFAPFNESTYLHQVVALQEDGTLKRYKDLHEALPEVNDINTKEWRSHFHVPLFVSHYEVLESTQQDIKEVLSIQQQKPFTAHLEVETYTWEVLPAELKLPLTESIIRELQWVQQLLNLHAGV
jgi:hypothetical protein